MWGEEHTPTAPPVDERMAADSLAAKVAAFLKHRSTGNEERMQVALEGYRTARTA